MRPHGGGSLRGGRWLATCTLGLTTLGAAAQPSLQLTTAMQSSSPVGEHGAPTESPAASWVLSSLYSEAALSGDRGNWRESSTELLYLAMRNLYYGGRIDTRTRDSETDVLYGASVFHQATRALEWHASVTAAQDPVFSADYGYAVGAAWRATPRVSFLLDYSRLEFDAGAIDQYRPGAVWWFTDRTFLTGRYTHGRAFGSEQFDAYLLRFDVGLPRRSRLALSAAHGADPDREPGVPGVPLSKGDTYAAYGHVPLMPSLELILGAEYEDRDAYTRAAGTVGFSWRF